MVCRQNIGLTVCFLTLALPYHTVALDTVSMSQGRARRTTETAYTTGTLMSLPQPWGTNNTTPSGIDIDHLVVQAYDPCAHGAMPKAAGQNFRISCPGPQSFQLSGAVLLLLFLLTIPHYCCACYLLLAAMLQKARRKRTAAMACGGSAAW